ncbi:hypothetical protein DFH27DRAFT_129988 [Peziza echinospora]|nr:hypothetical protein DFH27DRAFT_129988 [Peziza echinospora]
MDISLDDMIQKERRAKAASADKSTRLNNVPTGPRGGIAKRQAVSGSGSGVRNTASPASNLNGRWAHDLHHKNNPLASRVTKNAPKNTPLPSSITPSVAASLSQNRLFTALHGVISSTPPPPSNTFRGGNNGGAGEGLRIRGAASGFSIKGTAGPFVVRASNFAPGTTAEDVKTAMLSLGKIVSCIILSANPTVMAEIVFEKKDAAERCIAQYNNQLADGRLLHLVLHDGPAIGKPPSSISSASSSKYSSPAKSDLNAAREEADRQRRLAHQRNAAAIGPVARGGVIDGTFGFKAPTLYSDSLVQRRGRGFQK